MRNIVFKELRELFRDGRFKMTIGISLFLLVIALVTGLNQYKSQEKQYRDSMSQERVMWETQGEKNPHSAAHYGTYAFKPKFALSLFDNGVTKYTGNTIFLEAHNRNEASFSEASDQTSLARFGTLSINFVLLYLFPLIIVLTGSNLFTKELEQGTLTLLKSQGVSPIKLALGKWISLALPMFVLTLFVFFTTGLILSSLEYLVFFSWMNLAVIFGCYYLYYAVVVTITLWVSMRSKSSGMSLVTSLVIWIGFSFVAPKVATNFANSNHPYPSKTEFLSRISEDKKNGLDGHNPWNKAAKELELATLAEYGVDSIEQLPFNYSGFRMQKGEEHEAEIYAKHYSILKGIAQDQGRTYQSLSFISPFISLRFLSMEFANTSDNLHWKFMESAEQYRIETQRFLNYDIKDNSNYGQRGYKMTTDKFKNLAKFSFSPPDLSEILSENTRNIGLLVCWFVFPFAGFLVTSKKI